MFHKKRLLLLPILFLTFILVILLVKTKSDVISLNIKNENVELAIYLNDEETNSIPSKDSGYYYDR